MTTFDPVLKKFTYTDKFIETHDAGLSSHGGLVAYFDPPYSAFADPVISATANAPALLHTANTARFIKADGGYIPAGYQYFDFVFRVAVATDAAYVAKMRMVVNGIAQTAVTVTFTSGVTTVAQTIAISSALATMSRVQIERITTDNTLIQTVFPVSVRVR